MTKYLETYRRTCSNDVPKNFIEENMGLLHKVAHGIFGKNNTSANYDDVLTDCVIAVYDAFEYSLSIDISSIGNETAWIAQTVKFRTLQSLWDFHRGPSMSYNTMRAKRSKTGESPIDVYPVSLSQSLSSGDDASSTLEDFVAVDDTMSPEDIALSKEMQRKMMDALSSLNDNEITVISCIYAGKEQKSLSEASKELGKTKSSTFFTEKKALDKIRDELNLSSNSYGRYTVTN